MRFRAGRTVACVASLAGAGCGAGILKAQDVERDSDLVGLWGAEPTLNPQPGGVILLQRRGATWVLRAAGYEVSEPVTGDSIAIRLPGSRGALRARVSARSVHGFWVQPAQDGPSYATPLRFHIAGTNLWRAVLQPLELRFGLYLAVVRRGKDSLTAVFRNPLWNWPNSRFDVRRAADTLLLLDSGTQRVRYRQPYDSAARRITFDFGTPFDLRPRVPATAPGFVARTPGREHSGYRIPAILGDGWRIADAASVAFDKSRLTAVVRRLAGADPLDDTLPRLHALLVARDGKLVLDEYFHGYGAFDRHDLRSASKTITSIMLGVAMRLGASLGADTRARGKAWTLGNLLSHSSGVACDDDDDASPGNEDRMQAQSDEPDWYAFFMRLPQLTTPGRSYRYCSAGINMAGGLLRDATHRWLPEFFDTELARPMQIYNYAINLMPTGEAYSGGGMYLRPRDFLKFGELYRTGGLWNRRRLVTQAWVTQSTAHQIDRPDGSSDGFGWHRHTLTVDGRAIETYEASGNGGQFVVVVPARRLVIATTAGNYGQYRVWRQIRDRLVPELIAAAR
jgi:CubicO group peptidase (beta-lactamase class C family)